jgi:hypothetical protein
MKKLAGKICCVRFGGLQIDALFLVALIPVTLATAV